MAAVLIVPLKSGTELEQPEVLWVGWHAVNWNSGFARSASPAEQSRHRAAKVYRFGANPEGKEVRQRRGVTALP